MRLALDFSADNCVRLRVTSEPQAKNKGDSIPVLRNERYAQNIQERELLTSYLCTMDRNNTPWLDVYDPKTGLERVLRSDIVQRVARLDLLCELQRSQPSSRSDFSRTYAPTTFGRFAARSIREAGTILDNDYKGGIYLVTCTLPSDGYRQMQRLAASSSYVINRLFRKLRNIEGLQYYFVWEWQKRGALHLHLVVAHNNPCISASAAYRLRSHWFQILGEIGRPPVPPTVDTHWVSECPLDMFASSRAPGGTWRNKPNKWQWSVDLITKSVTGYLSKYLSKGNRGVNPHFYPSRWWGCCSALKNKIKALRVSIVIPEIYNDIARQAFYQIADIIGGFDPIYTLPLEHHVYRTVKSEPDPQTGGFYRISTDSVIFSLIGVNFYFSPDSWRELYHVFCEHFTYGAFLSIVDSMDSSD